LNLFEKKKQTILVYSLHKKKNGFPSRKLAWNSLNPSKRNASLSELWHHNWEFTEFWCKWKATIDAWDIQLDQNSLASEMRRPGNEGVSVRQGCGYGCRCGTLNEANLLKTARTCCSLEAWSADFSPIVHDLNTSRHNKQVRSASGRDFSPLRH
jgi:hypothetical protein